MPAEPPPCLVPLGAGHTANVTAPLSHEDLRAPTHLEPATRSIDKTKAARSVFWSLLENGGLALVSFGTLIVYSRYLTAAQFGVFSIALALVELLGLLVSMLFHDALVQKESVTRLHFDSAFSFTILLSFALCAGCVLFSSTFARWVGNAEAAQVLAWMSLAFPCSAISATLVAQQRRELEFKSLALRSLVGRLSGAAVGILAVVMGAGIWGLVAQQILIAFVGSLVLWTKADTHPRLRLQVAPLRELIGFGAYAISALFLVFAVKRVFVVAVGTMLDNAAAGYLNLSFRAVDVLWAIAATAINQVALPVLSRLQTDRKKLRTAYRTATEFTCLVMYPCFIGIAAVAPEIIELLFGAKWLLSVPYVIALSLLIIVQAPRLLISPTLTALGRPRDSLVGIAVELVVMLGLVSLMGARTLPYALTVWVVRELVAAPVMVGVLAKVSGISVRAQLSGTALPLLASGMMAAALWGIRHSLVSGLSGLVRFAILVPIGIVVYSVTMWVGGRPLIDRAIQFVWAASRKATQ